MTQVWSVLMAPGLGSVNVSPGTREHQTASGVWREHSFRGVGKDKHNGEGRQALRGDTG